MQVKRFVAPNMRMALKMVREELGPDAVILSNKRVRDGVELLTALEEAAPEPEQFAGASNPFAEAVAEPVQAHSPSKLELEVDRMQRDARRRADMLMERLQQGREESRPAGRSSTVLSDSVVSADKHAQFEQLLRQSVDQQSATAAGNTFDELAERASQAGVISTAPASASISHRDEELATMRAELQSMRDLMEQQLSSMAWGQFTQQQPQQASLWRRLRRMGVDAQLARRLLAQVDEAQSGKEAWQQAMSCLNQQLPISGEDIIERGGVFAFVGATGAGKTTTIGKLATRYVLAHGSDDVALVTMDTFRIAAHEQLRTFGRILNVPVKIVDSNNSLEQVLYSLRHKSLILIDTAGLNAQDTRLQRQLTAINEQGGKVKSLLVLPATSQLSVIKASYHCYRTDNLQACILTKLDESASLGEVVSLAIDKALPVAYSTHGQAIPEDIAVARGKTLISRAIELARHVDTDEQSLAEDRLFSVVAPKRGGYAQAVI